MYLEMAIQLSVVTLLISVISWRISTRKDIKLLNYKSESNNYKQFKRASKRGIPTHNFVMVSILILTIFYYLSIFLPLQSNK